MTICLLRFEMDLLQGSIPWGARRDNPATASVGDGRKRKGNKKKGNCPPTGQKVKT